MRDDRIGKLGVFATAFVLILIGMGTGLLASDQVERFAWQGKVNDGDRVVINNRFGDVRLRFGGYEGVLEVVGVIQLLRSDGPYLQVLPTEVADGTEIRVEWTVKPGLDLPVAMEKDRSRADLAVMVPLGVTIEVTTDDGLVEAQGVRGDANIHTGSGEIRITKHEAAVNAQSSSGRINAVLLKNATSVAQTFQTRSGSIEVWVQPDAAYRAVLTTSGAITTDFSINIEHLTGAEPDKRGTAALAEEGPDLLLSSLRGNVALRRLAEVHDGIAKP